MELHVGTCNRHPDLVRKVINEIAKSTVTAEEHATVQSRDE